jgi:hypothetical protein
MVILGADRILWPGVEFGNFSFASTYSLLCNDVVVVVTGNDNWKLGVPERVRSFIYGLSILED